MSICDEQEELEDVGYAEDENLEAETLAQLEVIAIQIAPHWVVIAITASIYFNTSHPVQGSFKYFFGKIAKYWTHNNLSNQTHGSFNSVSSQFSCFFKFFIRIF